MVVHGLLNSLATKWLAKLTKGFVFVNLGTTFGEHDIHSLYECCLLFSLVIIIVLLAKTPRAEMHPANYVFGSAGIVNQTGLDGHPGWSTGLAFLFGLLSVAW